MYVCISDIIFAACDVSCLFMCLECLRHCTLTSHEAKQTSNHADVTKILIKAYSHFWEV